jgi:hypothetical protein
VPQNCLWGYSGRLGQELQGFTAFRKTGTVSLEQLMPYYRSLNALLMAFKYPLKASF